MDDRYDSFITLAANETEGVDYRIRVEKRASPFAILAPHGGWIEPGTSEIADAIAANCFSLYCFEGLRRTGSAGLHITSMRFDEPRAVQLVSDCDVAIGVHGRKDIGDETSIWVGGLHESMRDAICESLTDAGFEAKAVGEGHRLAGRDPANICNRGRRGAGVQLELPKTLRVALINDAGGRAVFATSVRKALER